LLHGLYTTRYVAPATIICFQIQELLILSALFTAPTALSNGPTIIEAQADFVLAVLEKLRKEGVKTIEPNREAEDEWDSMIDAMNNYTLFPLTNSWWNRATIPGNKVQMLTHPGGIKMYEAQCLEALNGWKGFNVVLAEGAHKDEATGVVNNKEQGIAKDLAPAVESRKVEVTPV
jgi:hypothetical protein